MTGMELSTTIKHQLVATIIVLDNGGYETERLIHEGMFNDINSLAIPDASAGAGWWQRT